MERSFVILEHSGCGPAHYDLMMETGDVLATWQFERPPAALEAGGELSCKKIQDHRLWYLTYEGELSGGRGQVKRVEQGTFQQIETIRQAEAGESSWRFMMSGRVMRGDFSLKRQGDSDTWILTNSKRDG